MEWFSQNWVWVPFFAGFIAMHMFGHGGHGGGHNAPKRQVKTVCRALRNKDPVINIDH